jgi:hypothetical protein
VTSVIIIRPGLLPLGAPPQHRVPDQPRIVPRYTHKSEILRVNKLGLKGRWVVLYRGCLLGLLLLLEQVGVTCHDRGYDGWLTDQELVDLPCRLRVMMRTATWFLDMFLRILGACADGTILRDSHSDFLYFKKLREVLWVSDYASLTSIEQRQLR